MTTRSTCLAFPVSVSGSGAPSPPVSSPRAFKQGKLPYDARLSLHEAFDEPGWGQAASRTTCRASIMPVRTRILRVRDQTIRQLFVAERPSPVRYAGRFDGFHAVAAAGSKTCLVRFDNNRSSIAARAVGRPVESRLRRYHQVDLLLAAVGVLPYFSSRGRRFESRRARQTNSISAGDVPTPPVASAPTAKSDSVERAPHDLRFAIDHSQQGQCRCIRPRSALLPIAHCAER